MTQLVAPTDRTSASAAETTLVPTPAVDLTTPSSSPPQLERLAKELVNLKLEFLAQKREAETQQQNLRGRVRGLSLLLLTTNCVLLGAAGWLGILTYNQHQRIVQLKDQAPSAVVDQSASAVQAVQAELATLQQQVPDNLKAQLQDQGNSITDLEQSLEKLAEQTGDRQQAIAVMAKALQELVVTEPSELSKPSSEAPPLAPQTSKAEKVPEAPANQPEQPAESEKPQEKSATSGAKETPPSQPASSSTAASE